MIEPLGTQGSGDRGPEIRQPRGLGVDSPPAGGAARRWVVRLLRESSGCPWCCQALPVGFSVAGCRVAASGRLISEIRGKVFGKRKACIEQLKNLHWVAESLRKARGLPLGPGNSFGRGPGPAGPVGPAARDH